MGDKKGKEGLYADIGLLLVTIIWGSGFAATKVGLKYISPNYMMAIRFSLSFFLMSIVFWKKFKVITKKDLKAGAIVGFILYMGFAIQTVAAQYTNASKQAFLTATYVVMVPFMYWAIKGKRPDRFEIAGVLLCFLGAALLSFDGGIRIGLGDSLTLICAVFFASHIVAIGFFIERHDPIILTILQIGMAALLSIISIIFFEKKPLVLNTGGIAATLYLAIFSTLIAFLIQNLAQKYTSSTRAAIIMSMESVFGTIFPVIFLGDIFTIKMVFGCILIFTAIITAETKWNFILKKL